MTRSGAPWSTFDELQGVHSLRHINLVCDAGHGVMKYCLECFISILILKGAIED